jgi:cytochrome b
MNDDLDLDQDERDLLDTLAQLPPIEPAGDIRERFRERAETERAVGPGPRRWVTMALAAALVLTLGSGWWLEHQARLRDQGTLQSALATALTDLSAATRLNAVNEAAAAGTGNSAVITALTRALLTDSSVSVRVAAAKALGVVAGPDALINASAMSIRSETSPFVQNAVLTVAAQHLPAASRSPLIQQILAREDLDPSIRVQAEQLAGS